MAINFPNAPTVGQQFTTNGMTWTWDGTKWESTSAGGISEAPIDGTPYSRQSGAWTPAPTAANVQTVWQNIRYRNRIINGDISVDQRNSGSPVSPVAASQYIVDKWRCNIVGGTASKGQSGRNLNAANPPPLNLGWPYYLGYQTLTAYTVAAADQLVFIQGIEGINFNDANFGASGAQPLVLEFWAFSSVVGLYAGSLRGAGVSRSYVFSYQITAANTWQKIRINIPGDSVVNSAWQVAGTAVAIWLSFNIDSGSTFQAAPGSWVNGNFVSTNGAVNLLTVANTNLFYITGVALMIGAAAQQYNAEPQFKSVADNFIDCQRYYQKSDIYFLTIGYNVAGVSIYCINPSPVAMRVAPAITSSNVIYSNCSSLTFPTIGGWGFRAAAVVTANGSAYVNYNAVLDSDF